MSSHLHENLLTGLDETFCTMKVFEDLGDCNLGERHARAVNAEACN
jgi:hypothetical protein